MRSSAGCERFVDEFPERLLIGEIYLPLDRLVAYYGSDLRETHLPFNFSLLETRWHAREIATLIDSYEAALPDGSWPNWVLSNHDRPRIAARIGLAQARVAAILLLTLRGTPTIYYGDEIGLAQVPIQPDRIRDPLGKNVIGLNLGRDGARTPMQWNAKPNAGFSQFEPWLPLTEDWTARNVETLRKDDTSMYNLYRRLIEARRRSEALKRGSYHPISAEGDVLLYVRALGSERILIILNLGVTPVAFVSTPPRGIVLVSTSGEREGELIDLNVQLGANEGLIIKLAPEVDLSSIEPVFIQFAPRHSRQQSLNRVGDKRV